VATLAVAGKREAILEATIQVLCERGLSGLKIEEVARMAEVGKGTVYLYFHDKQHLLKALVEYRTLGFYALVEELVTQDRPFFDRLGEILERRFAFVEEWRGLWAAVAREAHPGDPSGWLRGLHERYQQLMETLVNQGMERGELDPQLDCGLTAAALVALSPPQLDFPRQAYLHNLLAIWMKGAGR
jgi:AcrR family transcriptional regulator